MPFTPFDWRDSPGDLTTPMTAAALENEFGRAAAGIPYENVKWFGAVGDGVANDTAAIQAAVAHIHSTNGGGLFFPAGNYICNTTLTFRVPVIIAGEGPGSTPSVAGTTQVSRLTFPVGQHGIQILPPVTAGQQNGGATCSRIQDLFLKGPWNSVLRPSPADPSDGIRYLALACQMQNVVVDGFGRDGFSADSNAANNSNMATLLNCASWQNGRNGYYTVGTNSNVITFLNCQANNNQEYGFRTGGDATPYTDDSGGFTCTFISCHGGFNLLGGFYDRGLGNQYYNCYLEAGPYEQKTLAGAINASQTTITVSSAVSGSAEQARINANGRIRIEDEYLYVTGGAATTTWTVVRAREGTTGATHASAQPVIEAPYHWRLVIASETTAKGASSSVDGVLISGSFGGFPVDFIAPTSAAFCRWMIRNPSRFLPNTHSSGMRVITGSRGANAALASLMTHLDDSWQIVNETT